MKIELEISNNRATMGQISRLLDEINNPTKKKNSLGFKIKYVGTRYNSIKVTTMGTRFFTIRCDSEFEDKFFESRIKKSKRWNLYLKGQDIIEEMTKFILRETTKEQKRLWSETRQSFKIEIKKECHPLLLTALYDYYYEFVTERL